MNYKIIQIDAQTWRIEEEGVRFFLLTGSKEAMLIDSGMQTRNAKEIAESLTELPLRLLNTHADLDHVGSNYEFDVVYMNPAECSNYYKTQKKQGKIAPVWDGEIIDLGERPLKVITLPGHTPGSIALLDIKNRVLISGDPIQDGQIFMFDIQREIHAYQHSLKKIQTYCDQFDVIYPSHASFPVKPELIQKLYDAVTKILNGEAIAEEADFHGIPLKKYDMDVATFLFDADFNK